MTDTLQCLTYDDFGHIIGNDRSGTAGDMSYAYNGNGALTMDLNKGIDNIEYDLLGNPIKLTIDNNTKRIEYVYAADGRRLKTKHSYITYVTKPRLQWETNYPNKKSPTYFVYHPESKKFRPVRLTFRPERAIAKRYQPRASEATPWVS